MEAKDIIKLQEYSKLGLREKVTEVKKALDAELYQAALALVLTIPDICGKIEFPQHKYNNKEKYIRWFDTYISQSYIPAIDDEGNIDSTRRSMNGEICYKLRCSFLHAGNDDIKTSGLSFISDEEKEMYKSSYNFRLSVGREYQNSVYCYLNEADKTCIYVVNIDLKMLCQKICTAAEKTIATCSDEVSDIYTTRISVYKV